MNSFSNILYTAWTTLLHLFSPFLFDYDELFLNGHRNVLLSFFFAVIIVWITNRCLFVLYCIVYRYSSYFSNKSAYIKCLFISNFVVYWLFTVYVLTIKVTIYIQYTYLIFLCRWNYLILSAYLAHALVHRYYKKKYQKIINLLLFNI